ncbi:MAG: reverse transcriptase family protein, partial [Muribaculaceae bacterium]|nr:reverse transcriptase family protein [Muribaculaceae bacterium]
VYEPSDAAMGFIAGRSVVDNARVHVGHNYVFNIDLKNFFPSISQSRVWKRLQLSPFCFTKEIANVVAGICCSWQVDSNANVLPQGSPVSPLLTNAICDNLDRRMKGVAKRFGLHYTRYADDMTFSSMHNVYGSESKFRVEIERIITEQGFTLNDSKTRLLKTGTRQEVTGLTVNAVVNVSRKYISDLRWILNVWEKEGYAKAYALFYPKYKYEKGYIKKGEPVMENVIGGKLDYLKMVRGSNNTSYMKLSARFSALQELVFMDTETDNGKSYLYVQPYSLPDFLSLFHTEISLVISRKKKVVGKCTIDGRDKTLSISKATQKILCPELDAASEGDIIQTDVLSECFVTLCRCKDKNFWLITKFEPKRSKCLSIQNLRVNPDELLGIWEKEGFESAAKKLALFLQYGGTGESILQLNSKIESGESFVSDRGSIPSGEQYLIRYFLKNRNLSNCHKARLLKLITPVLSESNVSSEGESLLSLWENEGLETAVKAWKARRMETSNYKSAGKKKFPPGLTKKIFKTLIEGTQSDDDISSDMEFDW